MAVAPRLNSAVRLLLVDADPNARRSLRTALETRVARPLEILETAEPEAARLLVAERAVDAVAADLATVGGPIGLRRLIERAPALVAYALGPTSNVKDAVAAVQQGAADFIEKPVDGNAFARRIERQFSGDEVSSPLEFVGEGRAMRTLLDQVARIAPSPAPVFVFGAPGTGKAAIARAVHDRSRRRAGPFVAIDCVGRDGADLVDAIAAPGGAFDRAAGGTLYLDEIGDLPDAVQALLLRAIETGEIGGADDRRRVDVRLVVSTNQRSSGAGRAGLRTDLYFRLAVLTLDVPSLKDRADDLPVLLDDIARRVARETGRRAVRFTPSARERLAMHDWPGNLRELRNVIEQLSRSAGQEPIDMDALDPLIGSAPAPRVDDVPVRPLWVEEAALIERAIAAFGGNIARAAAALEISPSTIYRKRRPLELAAV